MAERITPPSKAVARKDGIKMGANATMTTPKPTFGRYFGSNQPGSAAKGEGTLFGKK